MKNCAVFLSLLLLASTPFASDKDNMVEVTARDFSFNLPDSIPTGWTTFRFTNKGHAEHFFLLNRLPDSISYDRYIAIVPPAFQEVLDSLRNGMERTPALKRLQALVPAWYFTDVKQMGGSGIVSREGVTEVTLALPAGTYALECYIKEGDLFHTTLGMISPLVVTTDSSTLPPPQADVTLTLTNYKIAVEGTFAAGTNTVAVHFAEHPPVGLGNDVQVFRPDSGTTVEEVTAWLDWMNIDGLTSPAPGDFFGGIQEMPVGETAYFTTSLRAGTYLLIAESSAGQGMITSIDVE